MYGSQAYTVRKTGRRLIWGSYRAQHGGQRQFISSQWRNRIQNFYFSNLLENSEIKRQPIGNRGKEKNSSSRNKLDRGFQVSRTDVKEQLPCRLGEVKAIGLIWVNPIREVLKFPVPRTEIYKNTCIIVLDNVLLKEPIVIQLLTKLPEIFVVVPSFPWVFRVLGGST
jgi:hypothetical protein